jgi:isoquinoline 1-oxidoreductase beta subunit
MSKSTKPSAQPAFTRPAHVSEFEFNMNRRGFLRAAAAATGGLWVSMQLGCATGSQVVRGPAGSFMPNAWLRVHPDGKIAFVLDRVEMGQGTWTSALQIVAEELDIDPAELVVEQAPPAEEYTNVNFGLQTTGGSGSLSHQWQTLRMAGATAREALRAAAAQRWGVPVKQVKADQGFMVNTASKERIAYGELADAAAKVEVPDEVPLKDPKDFKLIGKSMPRHDVAPKTDGTAAYGMDFDITGMRTAVVVRCPVFGGTVASYDDKAVRACKGVEDVKVIDNGVAIIGDTYWHVRQASKKLKVTWDEGSNKGLSSTQLWEEYEKLAQEPGGSFIDEGDHEAAYKGAAKTVEAVYTVPFLAHATMEPQNATALVKDGKVTVWAPNQTPDVAASLIAATAGVERENVTLHVSPFLGGGFGRRLAADYMAEAVNIAKQVDYPVKLVWSREDDTRHDIYRPMTYNVMKGGVDDQGKPVVWKHRIVSQSLLSQSMPTWIPEMLPSALPGFVAAMAGGALATAFENAWTTDITAVEGCELPYAIDAQAIDVHIAEMRMPLGFWRSVGASENGFVIESFVDELAHLAGKDPLQFRLDALKPDQTRERAVLEKVGEMSGWKKGAAPGHHFGVASFTCFGTACANVIEVSFDKTRAHAPLKITRAWSAVHCGRVVTPDGVAAQLEGGLIFALSMALKQQITLEEGAVVQSNFHDYGTLRMHETPDIEVRFIDSTDAPSGVGEPGVAPVAAALTNAIFAATGKRVRSLPVEPQLQSI